MVKSKANNTSVPAYKLEVQLESDLSPKKTGYYAPKPQHKAEQGSNTYREHYETVRDQNLF